MQRDLSPLSPLMLAALLYLGAAGLLTIVRGLAFVRGLQSSEAKIRSSDAPTLCAVVAFGGLIGPVLMLFGLARISALTGSLLLNLEAVFTIGLAVLLFHEHLDRCSTIASAIILLGAVLLSYQPGVMNGTLVGVIAIVAACLSWAIDNNLRQRLSLRDPVIIVQVKSAGAGSTSLALAFATGHMLPAPGLLFGALALGCLSYGLRDHRPARFSGGAMGRMFSWLAWDPSGGCRYSNAIPTAFARTAACRFKFGLE